MTVRAWRARFTVDGLSRFGKVARGRGRRATIPQEVIQEIVDLTQNSVPHGSALEYPDNGQASSGVEGYDPAGLVAARPETPFGEETTPGSRRS
jgi:hypothetical protein